MIYTIAINNIKFDLHYSGAMFWHEHQMLLIADVHFGKVSHFRKHGSAVPKHVIHKNFERLNNVLDHFKPQKICFLGDLFHSYRNNEWELFSDWVKTQSTRITLINGNHDIISPDLFLELGIEILDELILDGFLLTHHPEERKDQFNICGHIHPAIQLRGKGRQRLKLSCFYQTPFQMILPAFGEFTGTHILKPEKNDTIYVLNDKSVTLLE